MAFVGVTMDACVDLLCPRTLRAVVCLSATPVVGTMARACSTIDAALTRLTHPIIRIQNGGGGGGYIYTSTDSGVTWTQQTNSGARNWNVIASSSDGTVRVGHERRRRQERRRWPLWASRWTRVCNPPLSAHAEGRSLSVGHACCGHDGEGVQHHRCRADSSYPPNHTHTETRRRG